MNYKIKANKFVKALKDADLDKVFKVTDESEEEILFQGRQTLGNSQSLISIFIRSSAYTTVYYDLGKLSNVRIKENMLELFNELNNQSLLLKFIITENNNLGATISYISTDESFDEDTFLNVVISGFTALEERLYSKIMRIMWS